MIERLFPKEINTARRSNQIGTLMLIPIVALKLFMGFNATTIPRFVAANADGVPLDRYDAQGADAVIAFFSLWGLEQVLLASIGVLALLRYRALIPFAYVVLAIEHFGRKGLLALHPFNRVSNSNATAVGINSGLMILLVLGLIFALFGKADGRQD